MKRQLLIPLLCITTFFHGSAIAQNAWKAINESTTDQPLPAPLIWHHKEKLYFLSDKESAELFPSTNVSGNALISLSSEKAPAARTDAAQWEDADHLWLWGGVSEEGRLLSDLWMYSVLSEQWQEVKNDGIYPPAARGAASWTDADGNLWMFGGKTDDISQNVLGLTNALWKWEKELKKWTSQLSENTPLPRSDMALWPVSGNKILMYGGIGFSDDGHRFGGLSDLWELDTSTLTWSLKDTSPSPYEKSYSGEKHPGFRIKPVFWKGDDGFYRLAFGQSEVSRNRISSDAVLWELNPDTFQWNYIYVESEQIMITASRIISGHKGTPTLFFPTYANKNLQVYTQPSIYTLTKTQPSK